MVILTVSSVFVIWLFDVCCMLVGLNLIVSRLLLLIKSSCRTLRLIFILYNLKQMKANRVKLVYNQIIVIEGEWPSDLLVLRNRCKLLSRASVLTSRWRVLIPLLWCVSIAQMRRTHFCVQLFRWCSLPGIRSAFSDNLIGLS